MVSPAFFNSLFFQDKKAFDARIRYVIGDSVYEETSSDDREASDLIDYLGFNDSCLYEERARHIRMLKDLFLTHAEFDSKEIVAWFAAHADELSFVTAVEAELEIDLTEVLERECL
jgi:hypothetical protein